MSKSKHRREPCTDTMFHKLCSPIIFWSCMIAGCSICLVYVLVVHVNSDSESMPASRYVAPEIDWELVKVLSEGDWASPVLSELMAAGRHYNSLDFELGIQD